MTYVMSDIHGNMRRFNSIMEQIDLQPKDTLYILGDVIDRYPDGVRILRKIMSLPNVKMLLGNHEYMMLRALNRPYDFYEKLSDLDTAEATRFWYRNGGRVTHQYWKRIRKDLREDIIQYLHSVPLNYDVEVNGTHFKLVHAAPVEEYQYFRHSYRDPTLFSVCKRWQPLDKHHGDYTLVFGHTPTMNYYAHIPMEIWYDDNRIGIDCGSGFPEDPDDYYSKYGRLACLRLDDGKEFYSEEMIEPKTNGGANDELS